MHSAEAGFPSYTGKLLLWSFVIGIIPPLALIYALMAKSLVLIEYIHVITGGTWTGFDLFMGLIMSMIFRTLQPQMRLEVAKRLTPLNFFAVPSLASVAIVAGIYLAMDLGTFVLTSPWIIAAGIVVIVLTAQGFGIFLPNSIKIFIEVSKSKPDIDKIIRLNMWNVRLAGVQAAFQIAIIFIMAHIAIIGVG
ncbi:MAG: hypothetical protein QXP70_03795 [Methanomassiliicoccales archaeon]